MANFFRSYDSSDIPFIPEIFFVTSRRFKKNKLNTTYLFFSSDNYFGLILDNNEFPYLGTCMYF